MPDTMYLDPDACDLTFDSYGNFAQASEPYATAQDVASECRLWKGEALFDETAGIPYETSILGELPPPAKLISWYKKAAENVPDVFSAEPILQFKGRDLGGEIHITLENGSNFSLAI